MTNAESSPIQLIEAWCKPEGKKQRIVNDFYPTPAKLIEAWYAQEGSKLLRPGETILEPCCGDGVFSNFLTDCRHRVIATDIVQNDAYDATKDSYWQSLERPIDWVVTNPPFNKAVPIIDKAIEYSRKGVICVLRASFLEPCKNRRHLLQNGKVWGVTYVNPRPQFRDTKGSDSSTVVFLTWRKDIKVYGQTIDYLTDWHLT